MYTASSNLAKLKCIREDLQLVSRPQSNSRQPVTEMKVTKLGFIYEGPVIGTFQLHYCPTTQYSIMPTLAEPKKRRNPLTANIAAAQN